VQLKKPGLVGRGTHRIASSELSMFLMMTSNEEILTQDLFLGGRADSAGNPGTVTELQKAHTVSLQNPSRSELLPSELLPVCLLRTSHHIDGLMNHA